VLAAGGADWRAAGEHQWHSEQIVLNELEFEWVRQFHIQGALHARLHGWWARPMARLEEFWAKLEKRTSDRLAQLEAQAAAAKAGGLARASFAGVQACIVVLLGDLGKRQVCHYMIQPLVELYRGCMVVLKVS
jgi:hypothetical protein